MVTDSFLSLACASLIAFLFGLTMLFSGYRLFLFLLPIWGFFFGLALGAQSLQALFGVGFLATITSWVVGFLVGAIFAVLSYLFYFVAVALLAGSIGYGIAVGLLTWIGLDMGFLVWIIGIIAGVALAAVTILFNLQKWVIIIATSLAGVGVIVATFVLLFFPAARFIESPVRVALEASPLLAILGIVLAILGIIVQARQNRNWEVTSYNRWEEMSASS